MQAGKQSEGGGQTPVLRVLSMACCWPQYTLLYTVEGGHAAWLLRTSSTPRSLLCSMAAVPRSASAAHLPAALLSKGCSDPEASDAAMYKCVTRVYQV